MDAKTKIKNDLWRVNWVIPFTAHRLQEGLLPFVVESAKKMATMRVAKGAVRGVSQDTLELFSRVDLGYHEGFDFYYWIDEKWTLAIQGNVLGNFPLDYTRVVSQAFDQHAEKAIKAGGKYGQRAATMHAAVHLLRDRCAIAIGEHCANQTWRDRMLDDFSDLLEAPARSFHAGLQRILFFNQIMWQTRHRLVGLGRLDVILGDLYARDLRAGVLDEACAYKQICDFLRILHGWYEWKSSGLVGDIGQIIIVGGLDESGRYFRNALTDMFIKAQADVSQPDPKVLLRVSGDMPDDLLDVAVEALGKATGSPLLSNDDEVVPRLVDFGFSECDARSYCVSACWEPFVPGKSLDQNNMKTFDLFRPLSEYLNAEEAAQVTSFDGLVEGYLTSLRAAWAEFLTVLDSFTWAEDPLVSMLTDGCTERKTDISMGGAKYSNYGATTIGMASVVDTLANIKVLVYEEQAYTIVELNEARRRNFEGDEGLLARMRALPKHFGHDDDLAVELTNLVISASNDAIGTHVNPLGGKVKFGLSSPDYIKQAKHAPADLAGRLSGDPYATHISCADSAYTELARFAGRLDYSRNAFNGGVIDFFVAPSLVRDHPDAFAQYLRGAMAAGMFQMQMNVLDSVTLIEAKAHPERYPGLIVRVWGFSAYFNDLPDSYKDLLIKRAQESEELYCA